MKRSILVGIIAFTFAVSAYGQKIETPTLVPTPLNAAQQKTLNEGVALHDQKKYDEAIAKYKSILAECPECIGAMYELALSLDNKGEKDAAVELAYKGTKYKSTELPLFYVIIANRLDDTGKPEEAIKLYQEGLKQLKDKEEFGRYRSSLSFNLAITYFRQKKYAEAKEAAKSAATDSFEYASPHFLLSVLFNGTQHKVPALLAASRFLPLEYNTARATESLKIFNSILKPATKDPKTGNTTIFLDLNAPKDEGDFGIFSLILGTITTVRGDDDKDKSDNQLYVDGISSLIAILDEDKKLKKTFVGRTYIPYMADMKKAGHVEAFGNMILFLTDNKNKEAETWLNTNGAKVKSFLDWAKAYSLPKQS
ncbi:MAG: tetratricopeptide repeat protein [Blastocatellia bacterium]|nr:tetratricopeptide repeat protein [Blastocatellia bacterium]